MIRETFDVAVLGSGFAGSLTALLLHLRGKRVVLLERGSHPRFALGESSTPLGNLSLEVIAREYGLDWLAPLAEYGSWKAAYPDLVVGLKRGFTFVEQSPGVPYHAKADHAGELLVEASPDDARADTHWLRADFDHFLVGKAIESGVVYLDRVSVAIDPTIRPWRLTGMRDGEPVEITARFLVDATGPAGALSQALGIDCSPLGMKTNSRAVFNHFVGLERWEDVLARHGGRPDEHPYPCDDAAVHHVLAEGWMWQLRFENGVTSAGVLYDAECGAVPDWDRTLARYPALVEQFRDARPVLPWVTTGRLQRRARATAGVDWAMLAPAAYSLDALYSTGNAHALHTVERLMRLFPTWTDGRDYDAPLQREIDFLDRLVHGTYCSMRDFGVLAHFAMYYFAGAISAEERRRRGDAGPGEEFLSSHIPAFRAAVMRAHDAVDAAELPDVAVFGARVAADLAPWNTTGLCEARKRNLYAYG
jgi:FADH2 O2-dependent halogenase